MKNLPEQSLFVIHRISRHIHRDEEIRMWVQMDHFNVFHRNVFRADGTIYVLYNLKRWKLHSISLFLSFIIALHV